MRGSLALETQPDTAAPPDTSPGEITRRRFLQAGGLATIGFGLYSSEIARHALQLTHRAIPIRNLPPAFHNFRIAQISDIHFEEFTEPFFLHRAIHDVNAFAPDLVLLTGDFITHSSIRRRPERAIHVCAEALQGLACTQRIGSLGNHDFYVGANFIANVLRRHHIPVLINQSMPIERNGDRLWIAGIEDPASANPDLTQAIPKQPDAPIILMSHAPDYADTVLRQPPSQRVDLMLSGHSHGGQVRLPILGPMILPPMGQKYVQGFFQLDDLQLYVNRGLGSVGLPFRLNCPPELTFLTLIPA